MRSAKILEMLLAAEMMGAQLPELRAIPQPKNKTQKSYKKDLSEYNTPPRSMTEEEKAYYDKHKKLDGFSKQ